MHRLHLLATCRCWQEAGVIQPTRGLAALCSALWLLVYVSKVVIMYVKAMPLEAEETAGSAPGLAS